MVNVLVDTSFLIIMANRPVGGIERLETSLGKVEFLIPDVVVRELERIAGGAGVKRAKEAKAALQMVNYSRFKFSIIDLSEYARTGSRGGKRYSGSGGSTMVDDLIVEYAESTRCYVATLDKGMIKRLKGRCAGIVTLQDDMIIVV
ncbi:MAG: PIN domain-containing protein [Candidatus Nitrosocaldus sp.]